MNDLLDRIIAIYPELVDRMELFANGSIVLRDDGTGGGAQIAKWTYELPQPSAQELAAATPSNLLAKRLEIDQILATMGRGKDRTLIQQVIEFAEQVIAPKLAEIYAVTLELAIMGLYARNKTYRECKDCEVACQAVEDAP